MERDARARVGLRGRSRMSPIEPTTTTWDLVPPPLDHPGDLWAVGADLAPGTVLAAYRLGLFPMRVGDGPLGWWWPEERAIVPVDRSLPRTVRRAAAGYEIRIDTSFAEVISGCADAARPGGWIDDEILDAYTTLHGLGWAHSVEAWDADGLAGGLYGVAVGGLFAAESMFHRRPGASKAALAGLVAVLRDAGAPPQRLLDAQWLTPHLALLGAIAVSRADYRARLAAALMLPDPFSAPSDPG
ncbi:MAG: leucyl/phenylalanyl-tRNA--protein transferase [Gaiella sp.]